MYYKSLVFVLLASVSVSVTAKTAKEDIYDEPRRSGLQFCTYPEPDTLNYSKVPEGYTPFYISTYMRHGSRYMAFKDDYEKLQQLFHKAEELGLLTELGKEVLMKVDTLCEQAKNRDGELTVLGARQHQSIARRMSKNFPEVFNHGGTVDAKSSISVRCILSMANAVNTLKGLNPDLNIRMDASKSDMYITANSELGYANVNNNYSAQGAKFSGKAKALKYDRLIGSLIKDYKPLIQTMLPDQFYEQMFWIASDIQNIETDIELMSLFTKEECYNRYISENLDLYIISGFSPLSYGLKPYSQVYLLSDIIEQADKVIENGNDTVASLRFGHEIYLLALASLMHINNLDYVGTDPIEISENYRTYQVIPMASNIQLVFFRTKKPSDPILVKIMLNEKEASIPVESIDGVYYKWSDVKDFFNYIIKDYK